jgi:hypothetical protein
MIASVTVVVPALAILVFLAFRALLGILGMLVAGATRGPAEGRRGCLGGCALFAVIVLFCVLGVAAFVAFAATLAGVTAIEHNPIRSIEAIHLPNAEHGELPRRGARDLFCLRMDVQGRVDTAVAWVRRALDLDEHDEIDLRVVERREDGAVVELRVPVDARDVRELERELERLGHVLPDGVRIELEAQGYAR